jgi:hypothetical protein
MSKSKEYSLKFLKRNIDGRIYNICSHEGGDNKSVLIFLSRLDYTETIGFINDLQLCVNSGSNLDESYESSTVEYLNIKYEYPNINIDNILILPMTDFIELLTEWKIFITPLK